LAIGLLNILPLEPLDGGKVATLLGQVAGFRMSPVARGLQASFGLMMLLFVLPRIARHLRVRFES